MGRATCAMGVQVRSRATTTGSGGEPKDFLKLGAAGALFPTSKVCRARTATGTNDTIAIRSADSTRENGMGRVQTSMCHVPHPLAMGRYERALASTTLQSTAVVSSSRAAASASAGSL